MTILASTRPLPLPYPPDAGPPSNKGSHLKYILGIYEIQIPDTCKDSFRRKDLTKVVDLLHWPNDLYVDPD